MNTSVIEKNTENIPSDKSSKSYCTFNSNLGEKAITVIIVRQANCYRASFADCLT